MSADRHPIAVDAAMRRPLGDISAGSERFTQRRVERILVLVVAVGCTVLGVQSLLNALGSTQEGPAWHIALILAAFVPLAVMVAACFAGVLVRPAAAAFAIVYPVVLVLWPAATAGRLEQAGGEPWIWYLINVGTVAAVVAFAMPLQVVWAIATPVLYGVVRFAQVGPDETGVIVLDVVFAMILATVIVTLGWMLRAVAVGIDRARRAAVASYAAAAAADAAEKERIAVAALMHDSVLAALIAAERASTPREEGLAVSMAREALTRLANADRDAGEGPDEPVDAAAVPGTLEAALADLGFTPPVAADIAADAPSVPGRVARALVLAAMQAVANAVQHAEGTGLRVSVAADVERIGIRIVDTGGGFDPAAVPEDRLGIRGSIVARMAAVGGRATVSSGSSGTVVALEWGYPA